MSTFKKTLSLVADEYTLSHIEPKSTHTVTIIALITSFILYHIYQSVTLSPESHAARFATTNKVGIVINLGINEVSTVKNFDILTLGSIKT